MTNPNRPKPPYPSPISLLPVIKLEITIDPNNGGRIQVTSNNPNIKQLELLDILTALVQFNVKQMLQANSLIIDPNKAKTAVDTHEANAFKPGEKSNGKTS